MNSGQMPLPDNLADAHRAIRKSQLQVEQMQRQIEQLLRQRFGSKSEKLHPEQLLLFGEAAVELPPAPVETSSKPKGGHGRQKLPANLPRDEVIHDLTPEQKACPECGTERRRIGEESSERLEYVPASLRVIVHKRPKYACAGCRGHFAVAARLPEPIERGVPGTGLLAHVIVSKYLDHLPLYRQERIFARQGVSLSRQTTCDWMAQCAGLLEPIWKAMKARILRSNVVMTDDTPVPVQDADVKGKNRTGRLWAYLGDRDHRFVVYDYSPDHRAEWPELFLKPYTSGYLQSDGYSGYDRIHARGIVAVGCWAHARRKFHEATSSDEKRAKQALEWIGRLYGVERAAKDEANQQWSKLGGGSNDTVRRTLEDQILAEKRNMESREILDGFSIWLESQLGPVLPKSPMGEAISYARSNWKSLTRYLEQPWLSIDNNASERAMRPIAVGRKNWLHLGSDAGGRTAAILLSVTQSAQGSGLESWAYLRDVLDRVSTHPNSRIDELLPDRWKPSESADPPGRKG